MDKTNNTYNDKLVGFLNHRYITRAGNFFLEFLTFCLVFFIWFILVAGTYSFVYWINGFSEFLSLKNSSTYIRIAFVIAFYCALVNSIRAFRKNEI